MAMHYGSGFCGVCASQRKVERQGPNHILHLLLTVFTGGLWVIFWILLSIQPGAWRCSQCGSVDVRNVH